MSTPFCLPESDVDEAVANSAQDLVKWAGARVLVTGATGVLGAWILSAIARANVALDLDLSLAVVSRRLANVPAELVGVEVIESDIRALEPQGAFDLVIHGALGASGLFGSGDAEPREVVSASVDGTRRVLACVTGPDTRLLFLSSGAVYGPQLAPVDERSGGAPDPLDPRSAYGESKRAAELLCASASAAGEVDAVIGRLFAFVGPRIPLDSYFAAGNFIGDLASGGDIHVAGDGRPRRSYLYCGDLPEWCLAIATRGLVGEAYNVGSPEPVTIAELAGEIASLREPAPDVVVHAPIGGTPAPWYVPVTEKAVVDLGLVPRVSRRDGIERWWRWVNERGLREGHSR